MPQTRECDFCGDDIEPGTGTMLVRKNGTTIHYCSAKCEKNVDLGREARDLEWTEEERPEAAETPDDETDVEEETIADEETEAAGDESAPDLEEAEEAEEETETEA